MYQWRDRAPERCNETRACFRHHDEYERLR